MHLILLDFCLKKCIYHLRLVYFAHIILHKIICFLHFFHLLIRLNCLYYPRHSYSYKATWNFMVRWIHIFTLETRLFCFAGFRTAFNYANIECICMYIFFFFINIKINDDFQLNKMYSLYMICIYKKNSNNNNNK